MELNARERTHLFCANQMGLRLSGDAKEPPHVRKSGYIITQVGENYIQTLSLIGLIIDVAIRERSWIGRTCAFGSPSISYVSDKLSKHHGL